MATFPDVITRAEAPEDYQTVGYIITAAFGRGDEADLVDALRRRNAVLCSLVAIVEGQTVGHILFTPATIESPGKTIEVAALGPLAVMPAFQRRGIGTALTMSGLEHCRAMGYGIAIVLGHPDYYPRFGFRPSHLCGIRWEHEAPPEAFMVAELIPGALEGIKGVASYQPEFSLV